MSSDNPTPLPSVFSPLAMSLLGTGYREATKTRMPRSWFEPMPHTHIALDDAIAQGALFCNMLAESRSAAAK